MKVENHRGYIDPYTCVNVFEYTCKWPTFLLFVLKTYEGQLSDKHHVFTIWTLNKKKKKKKKNYGCRPFAKMYKIYKGKSQVVWSLYIGLAFSP